MNNFEKKTIEKKMKEILTKEENKQKIDIEKKETKNKRL